MIVIDTETTGLWWQHNTKTFAIGVYDGDFQSYYVPVSPFTREPEEEFPQHLKEKIRHWFKSEPIILQNANFDIKALCSAGVFHWKAPNNPDFWENVVELSHLVHLNDSRDARSLSLKKLVPKYLNTPYSSVGELDRIVNRCRAFVRNRDRRWRIASKTHTPLSTGYWCKSDMWLPAALLRYWEDEEELIKHFKEDYPLLEKILEPYLEEDCRYTYTLGSGFLSRLLEDTSLQRLESCLSMNRQVMHVIWKMETQGIPIKVEELNAAISNCKACIKECNDNACIAAEIEDTKFTPTLKKELLFNKFNLIPISYTEKTGTPQVDHKSLVELRKQEGIPQKADQFLMWDITRSKYETKLKYLQSYHRAIQHSKNVPYFLRGQWALFPSLKATGTGTTRFSSNNPNSQNIEKSGGSSSSDEEVASLITKVKSLRRIFGPPAGRWWFPIDYSQLQLRIFAAATQDPTLLKSFEEGKDYHDFMAHVIFNLPESKKPTPFQRTRAKNVNFGFIFGAGEKKIDATAGKPGLYKYLLDCFPNVKDFLKATQDLIKTEGLVYTLGGYPLRIPLKETRWGTVEYAAHMGVNYIIQGTEGEIVKRAMGETDKIISNHGGRLVMQIHDELVFDLPSHTDPHLVRSICTAMEGAGLHYGVNTPVDVDVCYANLSERESFLL